MSSVCNSISLWRSENFLRDNHSFTAGKNPSISCQQIGDRIVPSQLPFNPSVPELTPSFSFIGIFQQPDNLGGKISCPFFVIGIQGCFLGAESTFFQIELHDGLAQGHVFHDLDHCGHVVHFAWLIRIDADIGCGENLQQLFVGNPSCEVEHIVETLILCHLPEVSQSRPTTYTSEMNITTSRLFDMQRHIKQDVKALLYAHGSDITDEVRLAVLQGRLGGDWSKCS